MKLKKININNLSYKSLLIILFSLLIGVIILWKFVLPNQKVSAAWWNDGWNYRKAVSISNTSGSNLTDFQVSVSIGTSALIASGKMQSDCDDIRITDQNGNLIPYWIEENNPGCNQITDTKIWVKASSVPTSGATVYLYYGNISATSAQSGTNTFDFFDDFSTNLNQWANSNTDCQASISSGVLNIPANTTCDAYPLIAPNLNLSDTPGYIMEVRGKLSSGGSGRLQIYQRRRNSNGYLARFWTSSSSTTNYQEFTPSAGTNRNIGANSMSVDTWYNLKAQVNGSNNTFYINNTAIGSTTSSASVTPFTDLTIGLGEYQTTVQYDNVRIRKYASTDPTSSLQAEEAGGGPVAYWKFDEGVGTIAYDSTTNRNNDTISNATWQTEDQCISGKCLDFPASGGGGATATSNSTLNFSTNNFTISAWAYLRDYTYPKSTLMVRKESGSCFSSGNPGFYIGHGYNSSGSTFCINDGTNFVDSSIAFDSSYQPANTKNKWTHFTYVFDRTAGKIKVYINGKKQSNELNISSVTGSINNSTDLTLGNVHGWQTDGKYDDIKIYSYARTAAQIKLDYNSRGSKKGSGANLGTNKNNNTLSDGLVGYWKMDEGVGTTTADSSGNSNTGTLTNIGWSSGKFGIGTSHNGSNSSIDFGNWFNFQTFTISLWVKPGSTQLQYADIADNNHTGVRSWNLQQNSTTTNQYGFGTMNSSGNYCNSGVFSLTADTWQHLVAIRNTNSISVYINGSLVTSSSSANCSLPITYDGTQYLRLGNWGGGGRNWNGIQDEVRIYNRALSPSEVTQLYEYAPGPVGYWDFEENTGAIAKDKSGNNNNGTLVSSPSWTSGKIGGALNFNGTSNYVNAENAQSLNPYYAETISAWVKLDTTPTNQSSNYPQILGKRNVDTQRAYFFSFEKSSSKLYWEIKDSAGTYYILNSTKTNWNTNEWYYVTATFDGSLTSNNSKIFVNGILDNQTTWNLIYVPQTSATTRIGGGSSYYLDGSLDEVKLYNYARSAKQIIEDMTAGAPTVSSKSMIAYYKFDEGSGTTANNSGNGGSALNGTLTNMASPATTISGWNNSGKFGKALSFDASDDYVDAGNVASLTFGSGQSFTYAAWIYSKNPLGRWQGIVYHGNVGQSQGHLGLNPSGQLEGGTGDGSSWQTHETSYLIPQNTWVHIAMALDRNSNILKFYANGVEVGNYSHNYVPSAPSISLRIGDGNTGGSEHFNGLIDEVKIYNYTLTNDEIKQDYNQGSALQMGQTNQTIGGTTTSLDYCIPGDTSACSAPVAEWNFEENTGTTTKDSSGNNNTGTFGTGDSAPTWTIGKKNTGAGLKFDGVNDYLTVPNYFNLSPATLEFWFKANSWSNSSMIISKDGAGPTNGYIQYYGQLSFYAPGNNPTVNWGNPSLNVWHHATLVITGTQHLAYLDGSLVGSPASSALALFTGNYNFKIGSYEGGVYAFNGSIDNVKIYNYARTPAQVAYDYNKGGPIGWWKLDECQGSVANDSSGLGNTGSIVIGAGGSQTSVGTCTTSGTAWGNGASGHTNSSLNFDGTDDYTSISNFVGSLTTFTVAGWIKLNADQVSRTIFSNQTSNSNSWVVGISDSSTNVLKFYLGSATLYAITPLTSGTWYHFAATYNNGSPKIYINGKFDNSSADTIVASGTYVNNAIGCLYRSGCVGQYFNGKVDDLHIYNYALTSEQVKTLYNGGAVSFN